MVETVKIMKGMSGKLGANYWLYCQNRYLHLKCQYRSYTVRFGSVSIICTYKRGNKQKKGGKSAIVRSSTVVFFIFYIVAIEAFVERGSYAKYSTRCIFPNPCLWFSSLIPISLTFALKPWKQSSCLIDTQPTELEYVNL